MTDPARAVRAVSSVGQAGSSIGRKRHHHRMVLLKQRRLRLRLRDRARSNNGVLQFPRGTCSAAINACN
jgi:hypothetical protein